MHKICANTNANARASELQSREASEAGAPLSGIATDAKSQGSTAAQRRTLPPGGNGRKVGRGGWNFTIATVVSQQRRGGDGGAELMKKRCVGPSVGRMGGGVRGASKKPAESFTKCNCEAAR